MIKYDTVRVLADDAAAIYFLKGAVYTNWVNYMVMAAQHSRGSASHWFRYLRKYIDKCGTVFTMDDVEVLYNSQALTPFQRVSIKAAFRDGSPTRQHIIMLNKPAHRDTLK